MRRLAALVFLALAASACGATGETEPEARTISAGQVSRAFQAETGRGLEPAAVADVSWEQLGYGLDPSPQTLRRFGIFNVYVVEEGNDEALSSLLSDKATGEPLPADDRGIHWERDSQSGTWVAHKRYGENVVLTWFSEQKQKATDERWERLDEILRTLPGAAQS